ncbi:uncharacterized protein LOC121838105 [Ixodes scapularis]|uniref:uncharacterized protein LOC121838105 n=1 Tax=Ixodes scapularis TaxID=6945 RepID=UPI001C381C03|nr:uncharacterized protein LOC121838105 [Ixodes scapularis]
MYCLQCHRGYAGHDFSLVSELELRMPKIRRPALFCGIECEKLLHSFQSSDSTAEHMIALASTSALAAPEHSSTSYTQVVERVIALASTSEPATEHTSTDSTAEHKIALASTSRPAAPEHSASLLHNLTNASCSMVCLVG